jgi:hypothetical protein
MSRDVVIEERLSTGGIVGLLVGAGVLEACRCWRARRRGARRWRCARVARLGSIAVVGTLACVAMRIVVRVVDEPNGRSLEIVYGPGGLVVQRFAPSEIVTASAGTAPVLRMGGFGYRGSLRLFRRAALITRPGEALVVELAGGRRFSVTVDDAASFATALTSSGEPSA